jgi:hypothetical protein
MLVLHAIFFGGLLITSGCNMGSGSANHSSNNQEDYVLRFEVVDSVKVESRLIVRNINSSCIIHPVFCKDSVLDCPFWDVLVHTKDGLEMNYSSIVSDYFEKTKRDVVINENNHFKLESNESKEFHFNLFFRKENLKLENVKFIELRKIFPEVSSIELHSDCLLDTRELNIRAELH